MKMTGEERIEVPRGRVWEALNDAEVLRRCIPGCLSLEREAADKLRAVVEVKVGPIGVRFNSTVTLSDIDPTRSYRLTIEGQGGTIGSAKSDIRVRLAEDSNGTLLSYDVEASIGGRLAQLGRALIDATAKQFATRFFKSFGEIVRETSERVLDVDGAQSPQGAARTGAAFTGSARTAAKPTAAARTASASAASGSTAYGSTASASTAVFESSLSRNSVAWLLAVVVAALIGFLVGRGEHGAGTGAGGSDWMGLGMGLLLLVVAAASFEYGRRTAAAQVVLDAAVLRRLIDAVKCDAAKSDAGKP